jgi:hypothetical protein
MSIPLLTNPQIAIIATAGCVASLLIFQVGREIYYAVNPGKRPIKKRRRKGF